METLSHAADLPSGLVPVSETESGYWCEADDRSRLRHVGTGRLCRDPALAARIAALVIPPQWSDVWISEEPTSYLQATGRDAKGRKQYIYHPDYVAYRQRAKFSKVEAFATALPGLRAEVQRQLRRRTWDRERMLALMVHLMDHTKIRVGNERYEAENKTYGLTTLRRRHLKAQPGGLAIDFLGKSGKFHHIAVQDKRLRKLLREVSELPGHRLFCYRCSAGKRRELDSGDVNAYLREHLGGAFTAKDFRTWGGTSLAVRFYPEVLAEVEARGKGKPEKRLVKAVAKTLGNTPAVCREYYIHPGVLAKAAAGTLPREPWGDSADVTALADYERYALQVIRGAARAPGS